MNKKEKATRLRVIKFDMDDLLFKQEHRKLNEVELAKLSALEVEKQSLISS